MSKHYWMIPIFLLMGIVTLLAQQPHFCGTDHGRSDWLKAYQKNPAAYPKSSDNIFVPVQIHLVGTDQGSGFYPIAQLNRAFCKLQENFEPTGIRLYMTEEINYVYSSKLYYHETFQEADTTNVVNYPDVVNVYIAEEAAGNCGYAAYWSNTVVLAKRCIEGDATTWAHEMGHVFSLPHPFSGNTWPEGVSYTQAAPADFEKVDGSNCTDAGDGFCDTPPDYLGFRWQCNGQGMSSLRLNDPDSVQFQVDGSLIMSYSNDGCADRFSDEQIGAMQAFIMDERPEYIKDEISYLPIEATELQNVSPENGGEVLVSGTKLPILSWDPIENATYYIVEVSRFSNFSFAEFKTTTSETSFILDSELILGLTYYWRVKASNPSYVCSDFMPTNSFAYIEAPLSTNNDLNVVNAVNIHPNPVTAFSNLTLTIDAVESSDLSISLVSITGQTLWMDNIRTTTGSQQFNLPLTTINAGLYYVVLANENGRRVEKIIVQ